MTECLSCEGFVSHDFARVYGDNDGNLYRCLHCIGQEDGGRSALRHGAGATPDIDEVLQRMQSTQIEA